MKKFCYNSHKKLWSLLIIDFFSKRWALKTFVYPYQWTDWLTFEVSFNRGISWSMLAGYGQWISLVITAMVGIVLFGFSWYISKRREAEHCVFGETLVLVGGTGNLLDRLRYGAVVDFIHGHYGAWSFPIFNIADVCIVVGVAYMVWQTYRGE